MSAAACCDQTHRCDGRVPGCGLWGSWMLAGILESSSAQLSKTQEKALLINYELIRSLNRNLRGMLK